MARKIVLKENGLSNTPNTPNGYKYLGDDSGNISEKIGATISAIGGSIIESKITIPTSNVKTLNSAPYELIPAPGAGKVIDVISAVSRFIGGTVSYANSGYIKVQYGGSGGSVFASFYGNPNSTLGTEVFETLADWISDGSSSAVIGNPAFLKLRTSTGFDSAGDESFQENESIELWASTDNTIGNSDMIMYLTYRILTL
jgi:hypothetical protein